jgi:hypothetical protein
VDVLTWSLLAALVLGVAALVTLMRLGRLTLDTGWGRTEHPLGPIEIDVTAPVELVFQQISAPYLGRTPSSLRGHIEVLERGDGLVLARHWTKSAFTRAETVEVVGVESPDRIRFRHVRGPVPYAVEEFVLHDTGGNTRLEYRGTIGLDFWVVGWVAARLWVRPFWVKVVRASMEDVKRGAEARAEARARRAEPAGEG